MLTADVIMLGWGRTRFSVCRSAEGGTMAEQSTFDRVKRVTIEQLGVAPEKVTPEASFEEDLGADSLDRVELIMGLEEEFEIEIPDDKAEKVVTVQDAVKTITDILA